MYWINLLPSPLLNRHGNWINWIPPGKRRSKLRIIDMLKLGLKVNSLAYVLRDYRREPAWFPVSVSSVGSALTRSSNAGHAASVVGGTPVKRGRMCLIACPSRKAMFLGGPGSRGAGAHQKSFVADSQRSTPALSRFDMFFCLRLLIRR